MRFALTTLLLCSCSAASAAELSPLLTESGVVLLAEDFAAAAPPKTLRMPTSPQAFRVVDGALEMTSRAGQERSTHATFAVAERNLSVSLAVTFVEPGSLFISFDGYNEMYRGNAHLVRFALTPTEIVWDEKRGGPESKREVGAAMKAARAARKPLPQPTAEQLADPKFFHTATLATKPFKYELGRRYDVLLEVNGNDLVAQIDGQVVAAVATVADAEKSRLGLGLTGRSTALLDDIRITANTRRNDWEQVLTKLKVAK